MSETDSQYQNLSSQISSIDTKSDKQHYEIMKNCTLYDPEEDSPDEELTPAKRFADVQDRMLIKELLQLIGMEGHLARQSIEKLGMF